MSSPACKHEDLSLHVSDFGRRSVYKRASASELATASTEHNDVQKTRSEGVTAGDPDIYPAPLVLPDDLLALDDDDEPQTLHEYIHYEDRNQPTAQRKTIYLVLPPKIDKSVAFMSSWSAPVLRQGQEPTTEYQAELFANLVKYVSAYYHGLPVKIYKKPLTFTAQDGSSDHRPDKVDMLFNGQLLDVRTRKCPDGTFARQLNLNDMIDVLINLLPTDAYSIMMLVDQDVWEDEEDDFTCGRAYGASRVSLVSSARYNPALDLATGIDLQHAWPASHCRAYIDQVTADYEKSMQLKQKYKRSKKTEPRTALLPSAMRAAVDAFTKAFDKQKSSSPTVSPMLWLSRVCRTVSHELGHCVAMDHCSYYACMMQGTCSALEDMRQPPYLCPIDEAKLLLTTGATSNARDEALLTLFDTPEWKHEPMFAAYAAWLRARASLGHYSAEQEDDSLIYLGSKSM